MLCLKKLNNLYCFLGINVKLPPGCTPKTNSWLLAKVSPIAQFDIRCHTIEIWPTAVCHYIFCQLFQNQRLCCHTCLTRIRFVNAVLQYICSAVVLTFRSRALALSRQNLYCKTKWDVQLYFILYCASSTTKAVENLWFRVRATKV